MLPGVRKRNGNDVWRGGKIKKQLSSSSVNEMEQTNTTKKDD